VEGVVAGQDDIEGLIARCAQGSRPAFAELYRRTAAKLNGVISRILQHEAAEEALQEAFVRIWQNAASFDARIASPIAWMSAIARNQAIDLKRRGSERISALSSSDEALLLNIPADRSTAEESVALIQLQRCLEQLPSDRRELVLLAYYRGLSRDELAGRSGKPAATIKSALRRSLLVLKECLDGR
jgi:RNA polymerase sigma-70 factor, ECF subfamily